jgi:hypothetical protein
MMVVVRRLWTVFLVIAIVIEQSGSQPRSSMYVGWSTNRRDRRSGAAHIRLHRLDKIVKRAKARLVRYDRIVLKAFNKNRKIKVQDQQTLKTWLGLFTKEDRWLDELSPLLRCAFI